MRLLLIGLGLVSGCSCGSSGSSADATVPDDASVPHDVGVPDSESVFVDARPRDASLPCEGTVVLLPVEAAGVPPAVQRSQVRAARDGDGLVLGWFNVDETGAGEWLVARVRDPDAPRTELVDPLPLPGLVGLYAPDAGGVRVLMTEAANPRGGISRGGWADLEPDGTFGELHPFETPEPLGGLGSGFPCAATDDAAAVTLCSSDDVFGATVIRLEPTGASTFFDPVFGGVFGSCGDRGGRSSYGLAGCVVAGGVTSVLMSGSDASLPFAVAEWRPDGTLLHTEPVRLGSVGGELNGIAAVDAAGPVYFVLAGSPDPRVTAYRIAGGEAMMVGERSLDSFPDPVVKPLGVAVIPDDRLILVYRQSHVLSVIAFGDDRFSGPTIVANVSCSGGGYAAMQTPLGVYLPLQCFIGDQLTLLRVCGG